VKLNYTLLISKPCFFIIRKYLSFTLCPLTYNGKVIGTQNHILCGRYHRPAVFGIQYIVRSKHEQLGLRLSFGGQGNVHGHLVSIKVSVVSRAYQGVNLQSAPLNQDRLKGLYSQPVKCGRTIQENRVFLNNFLQYVPDLRLYAFNHPLGTFNIMGKTLIHQLLHYEGFEQLQGHFFRQATLVHLQLGTHNDHRPARIVDSFTQKVLAEAPLLTLQHVA